MSPNELKQSIEFGLENLEMIYRRLLNFAVKEIDEEVKTSALTYECLGYYNAIEHLIIRVLKHLKVEMPSGAFSHRDTLRAFETLANNKVIDADKETLKVIEDLMTFRHVATKIYGFLIDPNKLQVVVHEIEQNHVHIKRLFDSTLNKLAE